MGRIRIQFDTVNCASFVAVIFIESDDAGILKVPP